MQSTSERDELIKTAFAAAKKGKLQDLKNTIKKDRSIVNEPFKNRYLIHVGVKTPRILEYLLDNGADVNQRDLWFMLTPLHAATTLMRGNEKSIQLLINRGADVNACDEGHATPLRDAAGFCSFASVKLLVDAGANIENVYMYADDQRSNVIETALHAAALNQEDGGKITTYLLSKGANIEAQYEDKFRPIHEAVAEANIDVIKALLEGGADLKAKTQDNQTPLDIAGKNLQIIQLLSWEEYFKGLEPAPPEHKLFKSSVEVIGPGVFLINDKNDPDELHDDLELKESYFYSCDTDVVITAVATETEPEKGTIIRIYAAELLQRIAVNPLNDKISWVGEQGREDLRKIPQFSAEGGGRSHGTKPKPMLLSCMHDMTAAQKTKMVKWLTKLDLALMNEKKSVILDLIVRPKAKK